MASDASSVFITASRFQRNIESFHFARKGLAFDAENVGRLRLIPAGGAQNTNDVTFLRLIERYEIILGLGLRRRGGFRFRRRRDVAQRARRGDGIDERAGIDNGAADDLLELTNIARPRMRGEDIEHTLRRTGDRIA